MSGIGIVGAGAWGCALAVQAARAGNQVTIWARDPARLAQRLGRRTLPAAVRVTHHLDTLDGEVLLLTVPVQHMRPIVGLLPPRPVIACSKGMETDSLLLPLEILRDVRPDLATGVLSGPNFAHEVIAGQPGAAVLASVEPDLREAVRERLATSLFRIYGSSDPLGVQIGGAAKNVIAIAAGAVIGAGLGENARAGLVTRGLAELARLVAALGGQAQTSFGLSGLGDLMLTCTGASSRNYSLGMRLGRGEDLAGILASRDSVTEGVATAPALVARGAGVDLPICAAVAALVEGKSTLRQAVEQVLARPRRDE